MCPIYHLHTLNNSFIYRINTTSSSNLLLIVTQGERDRERETHTVRAMSATHTHTQKLISKTLWLIFLSREQNSSPGAEMTRQTEKITKRKPQKKNRESKITR